MSDQSTHLESPVVPDEAVQEAVAALLRKYGGDPPGFSGRRRRAEQVAKITLAAAVPALHAAWAEAEDRGERVSRALSHHWVTSVEWGGERRNGCAKCRYMDGVHYLWPCPTVQALTGCEAPDPLPQDRARRAEVEALLALGAVTETKEDQK